MAEATYSEYLKSCGASDDEVKILDTPIGRKSYERMLTGLMNLVKERDTVRAGAESLEARVDQYYRDTDAKLRETQNQLTTASADAAKFRAALLTAQRQGLVDVAKDLGFTEDELKGGNPPARVNSPANGSNGFDPEKYFTRDDILSIADREGDAIALAQDIAAEHHILFPDRPLRFRELRDKAKTQKKPVEQVWMEEFKVGDARKAAEEKRQKDHDEAIAKAAREKLMTELAPRLGANPDMRPLEESRSPFAPRPTGTTRSGKQPWEVGTSEQLHDERVRHGTELAVQRLTSRPS